MRRHEIFAREKFFFVRVELQNRLKVARTVAFALSPVGAVDDGFFFGRELQNFFHEQTSSKKFLHIIAKKNPRDNSTGNGNI